METITFNVVGMTCGHCVAAVSEELAKVVGVQSVDVDLASGVVTLEADGPLDDEVIDAAVDEAGYDVRR